MSRVKVYLSWCDGSQDDRALVAGLKQNLSPGEQNQLFEVWDIEQVRPGKDREQTASQALEQAEIVVCLLSSEFLASGRCTRELGSAQARFGGDSDCIFVAVLRDCAWRDANLQLEPAHMFMDGELIGNLDQAMASLASLIFAKARALRGLASEPSPALLTEPHLRDRCRLISGRRIETLSQSGRYSHANHITRPEAEEDLRAFAGSNQPYYYLVGESGAGKTELLLKFTQQQLTAKNAVLFLDLQDLRIEELTSQQGLEQYILSQLELRLPFEQVLRFWNDRNLRKAQPRRLILIFDQLDRVIGDQALGTTYVQRALFAASCDLARTYGDQGLRIVLPVRPETHRELIRSDLQGHTLDLRRELFFQSRDTEHRPPELRAQPWVAYLPPFSDDELDEAVQGLAQSLGIDLCAEELPRAWCPLLKQPFYLFEFMRYRKEKGCFPTGEPSPSGLYTQLVAALSEEDKQIIYGLAARMNRSTRLRLSFGEIVQLGPPIDRIANGAPALERLVKLGFLNKITLRDGEDLVSGLEFSHDQVFEFIIQNHREFLAKKLYQESKLYVFFVSFVGAFTLCLIQMHQRFDELKAWTRNIINIADQPALMKIIDSAQFKWIIGMHSATSALQIFFYFMVAVLIMHFSVKNIHWSDQYSIHRRKRRNIKSVAEIRGADILALLSIRHELWLTQVIRSEVIGLVCLSVLVLWSPIEITRWIKHGITRYDLTTIIKIATYFYIAFVALRSPFRRSQESMSILQKRETIESKRMADFMLIYWYSMRNLIRHLVAWAIITIILIICYVIYYKINYYKDVWLTTATIATIKSIPEATRAHTSQMSIQALELDAAVRMISIRLERRLNGEIDSFVQNALGSGMYIMFILILILGLWNFTIHHLLMRFRLRRLIRQTP